MAYLLDTNVAIHLRDGDPAILARFEALEGRAFLSVVSRVELEGGVHARPEFAAARRRALDAILAATSIIDFSDAAAALCGTIVEKAGFSRRKLLDRMIAATVLQHGLTLITCNPADFQDVEGLVVEGW